MRHMQEILQDLTDKQLLSHYPIDLRAIADTYDIEVEYKWMGNIAGKIFKNDNKGRYTIYVSVLHPEEIKRFTLAHELAHFFLHKEHIGDGIEDDTLYRSGLSNKIEIEANRLASDIIMPAETIKKALDTYENIRGQDKIVKRLADDFKVSVPAMKVRIGLY